jgi:hypothetical protein
MSRTYTEFQKEVLTPNIKGEFIELTEKEKIEYVQWLSPSNIITPLKYKGKIIIDKQDEVETKAKEIR